MIEWTVFHRLLNIPETVIEPTYYDLLEIKPGDCTATNVARALRVRKKQLRQNIPGPSFIPLVLAFEAEQLELAAQTLSDPQTRQAYDTQLTGIDTPADNLAVLAQRRRMIQKGRKLVLQTLNSDGTLSEEKRPELAQQLAEMGFSQGDIRVLFQGIPICEQKPASPDRETKFFASAVALAINEGILDRQDEQRLLALAEHLSIPATLAIAGHR